MTNDKKQRRKPLWTKAQRLAARERILKTRPWEKSTGPKTEAGKARSALNAYKGMINWVLFAEYMLALKYHKKFMEQIRMASTIHLERAWLRQRLKSKAAQAVKHSKPESELSMEDKK